MRCRVVKIEQLSGCKASVYSIIIDNGSLNLLDKFIEENEVIHKKEVDDIVGRLYKIGKRSGAREGFFKLFEGGIGDGVCALYDIPRSKLRLYCIRYGSTLIIAGDGAVKPKGIRALQEDERLKEANYLLRRVSKAIKDKMLLNEIKFCNNSYDFKGELDFEIDCYEKK